MAEVPQRRILRVVVIYLNDSNVGGDVAKVKSLASSNQDRATGAIVTVELEVIDLDTCSLPLRSAMSVSKPIYYRTDGEAIARMEETIKECLGKAILSMQNLVKVRWKPLDATPDWAIRAVMAGLSNVPNLESFDLDLGVASWSQASLIFMKLKWPFPKLQHLSICLPKGRPHQTLRTLSATSSLWQRVYSLGPGKTASKSNAGESRKVVKTITKIASILRNASQLQSLKIEATEQDTCELFGDAAVSLNRFSLTWNSAYNASLTFHGSAFRGLTALHISESVHDATQPSRQEVWEVFKASDVRLERLQAVRITDSLLEYLCSYSGTLTELGLDNSYSLGYKDSDRLAKKFFELVLPQHKRTLSRLSLYAYHEGDWCLTSEKLATDFVGCVRLRWLAISVRGDELGWPYWLDSDNDCPDEYTIVHRFLDSCILNGQFPRLEFVRFHTAIMEGERGGWCGTGASHRRHELVSRLKDLVENYDRCRSNADFFPSSPPGSSIPILRIGYGEDERTLVEYVEAEYTTWR